MGSPRGDSAVTRQSILAAARELFAARGADSVGVREIAAQTGVNHALVHRCFGAKNDIAAAIGSEPEPREAPSAHPDQTGGPEP